MYLIIDIETENTGSDIMRDNKRIISVQIGDATEQELYYDDSKDSQWTLGRVETKIASLLSQECIFAGYNIKGFDIPLLKRFLKVEIPESNILDLCQTPRVTQLAKNKNRRNLRLEEVCMEYGIEVTHKQKMNKKAEKYKARQDIKDQAKAKAKEYVNKKGWSLDFSYDYVLNKIAGGNAIFDAYREFVKSGGQKDTLFYEYAIGDVICEYRLLEALKY
ncbi:MAG: ribonuclease H-like domain-containing protein [Candidatus Bathyarchaeota archaeon]|nr:ribonuclease H-like domain-containing protein [Candidatus Bathyarchaeota archaeon]